MSQNFRFLFYFVFFLVRKSTVYEGVGTPGFARLEERKSAPIIGESNFDSIAGAKYST